MPSGQDAYPGLQKVLDVVGAMATGIWVGAVYALSRNSGEPDHPDFKRCIAYAMCSFAIAGLLFLVPRKEHAFGVPTWLVVLVLGSAMTFVSIVWLDQTIPLTEGSFANYLFAHPAERSVELFGSVLMDVFLAMPIIVLFHYGPKLLAHIMDRAQQR